MIERTRREERATVYAALLDDAHEAIFALDADGKILHANTAAARLTGRQRQHLVGKPFVSLLAVVHRRDVRTRFRNVATVHETLDVTLLGGDRASLTLRRLAGVHPVTLAAALEPASSHSPSPPSSNGQIIDVAPVLDRFFLRFPYGVVGLTADHRVAFVNPRARQLLGDSAFRIGKVITNPVLAEFAERVVAVAAVPQIRRIELEDGRFLRASGIGPRGAEPAVLILEDVTAEELRDRVMREFVRNAAHQLRTPLTGIATAVEVLQGGAKNDPVELNRFLGHVEAHSKRLVRIARGLLVLARAQAGEPMRLEFVALRPLLEELAEQARPQPGVEIAIDCDPLLAVLAERDLAHEVLAGLVDNAVRHTQRGTIQLSGVEANGSVAISVTDTGGGVLPEHRDRIFEPFYRPESSGDGFGLGLAIAAQATKAMDGELTVDDTEQGARFTVRLASGRILA